MRPLIFNVDKPAGMTSYDVIRHFKKNLPRPFGKIGHFGTLDPFATGILMIGVAGASRLNEDIHSYLPKTYLACGELGVVTATGDMTSPILEKDEDAKIPNLSLANLQDILSKQFLGEYWQSPPSYSAAKFQGRPLHEWARKGVQVVKDPKKKYIHKIEVVNFQFPFLTLRVKVSSGTYIRTLFQDCAKLLGTLGTLHTLEREFVGHVNSKDALKRENWPEKERDLQGEKWDLLQQGLSLDQVLPLPLITLSFKESQNFLQGKKIVSTFSHSIKENPLLAKIEDPLPNDRFWVYSEGGCILGMGQRQDEILIPVMNFP